MIPELSWIDFCLGFIYLFLIYLAAFIYKNEKVEKDIDFKYFMYGLSAKLFGGVGFLLLSLFYWKGGDTFTYFQGAEGLTNLLYENPIEGIKVLFTSSKNMNWYNYEFAEGLNGFLSTTDTFFSVKVTAVIGVFCFNSFVVSTIVFSSISFLGIWNMYFVFCKIYTNLKTQLLFAFFFIPSIILWGSGILKDTITIAAIGWLMYGFINIVLLKRKQKKSLILIILATLSIALLKPYILYILYPSLFIWVQSNLKSIFSNDLIRRLISPFIALVLVFSSYFLSKELSQNAGKYDVNKLEKTLEGFQSWHTTVSEQHDQSGYTLGDMDMTPRGILKKIPAAIEVTFFRPYPWEVRNASTFLGAIEGLVLLIMVLRLLLKLRLKFFKIIYRNKDILFLMLFSSLFAVMVGISSYNFGALSRYKMPAQMFFILGLILINNEKKKIIN